MEQFIQNILIGVRRWVKAKLDEVTYALTNTIANLEQRFSVAEVKLGNIEDFAQVNKIETITVNGQAFIFSLLNDPAVDSYCEVTFDKQNEETSEIEYFKDLLDIKEKNSIIIKIIKMAENGEIIDELAKSDLVNQEPEIAEQLTKAIQKMEMIVWEK
jgi:hypothetical protein